MRPMRVWRAGRCGVALTALLLLAGLWAAFMPHVVRASEIGTVRVVITRVKALDCFDEPCAFINPDQEADFFTKIWIDGGDPFTSGIYDDDNDNITPDWQFSKLVNFGDRATIPIRIEIWDDDRGSPTNPGADQADLKPQDGRPLDLNLQAAPCFVGGDASGDCFATITSSGSEEDRAEIQFRVEYVNTPPTISQIGPQTTTEDAAIGPIGFTVGDQETAVDNLELFGSSSNQAVVRSQDIVFGGSGADRTVLIRPAPDASGATAITVRVFDGARASAVIFIVTVTAVNDAPDVSAIADRTTPEDIPIGPIPFTVSDVDTSIEKVTVSATSSNHEVVPDANVTVGGGGINRTLIITPTQNAFGETSITVRATDDHGTQSQPTIFTLNVTPENDDPIIGEIAPQTMVVGSDPIVVAFRVSDLETPADDLVVSASSFNPGLIPNSGLLAGGEGASRTLALLPIGDQPGTATITITVTDPDGASSKVSFNLTLVPPPPIPPPPWLVLLYLAGDDIPPARKGQLGLTEPLKDLISRLRGLEPNLAMRLVVLFDGTEAKDSQLYVREPGQRGLHPPEHLPGWWESELDTGSRATLRDFLTWARVEYPGSPRTMLSIVDHGGGWAPDEGGGGQPRGRDMARAGGLTGMSFDASANDNVGTSLSTKETREALNGLGKFDVLFFDACLMGMVESAYEVQPYADYFIAGQNILWSRLPYDRYFDPGFFTGTISSRDLAAGIVERYNPDSSTDEPYTIAAIDMGRLPAVMEQIDALGKSLGEALALPAAPASLSAGRPLSETIKLAYLATQKFDYDSSYTIDEATDAYVDLPDFAQQLLNASALPSDVERAARGILRTTIGPDKAIIATKAVSGTTEWSPNPWNFPRAHGLSIYLPLGELDCRPTGLPYAKTGLAAILPCKPPEKAKMEDLTIESQLKYYANPEQLTFTQDAPGWPALLVALQAITPQRDRGRQPIASPFPADSQVFRMYFPIAYASPAKPPCPDLVVSAIEVLPAQPTAGQPIEVVVTITNQGTVAITTPVWIDLYVDPRELPRTNRIWPELSTYGATWRVHSLGPGESRQITTRATDDPADPSKRYSNFPSSFAPGTYQLYALSDSYKANSAVGAQSESSEDNNLSGPHTMKVTGGHQVSMPTSTVMIDLRPE